MANLSLEDLTEDTQVNTKRVFSLDDLTDDKEEEKICNTIANGLTTVFVDNPSLLSYLQKNLKGEK